MIFSRESVSAFTYAPHSSRTVGAALGQSHPTQQIGAREEALLLAPLCRTAARAPAVGQFPALSHAQRPVSAMMSVAVRTGS